MSNFMYAVCYSPVQGIGAVLPLFLADKGYNEYPLGLHACCTLEMLKCTYLVYNTGGQAVLVDQLT